LTNPARSCSALHYLGNGRHFPAMQSPSEIASQGQVSVPAAMRQALGVGPGAMLEWVEVNGRIILFSVRHGTQEIRDALFA